MTSLAFALPFWPQVSLELPQMLWLLPLPLLIYWLVPARKSQTAALRTPYAELAEIRNASSLAKGRGPNLFAWLAWIALVFAACLPRMLGPPVNPAENGRDLMMVLDLSQSMTSDDMMVGAQQVDRLTAAKVVLNEFLPTREGDRIGLIVFGSNAYVMTPITRDLRTVREQLISTQPSLAGPSTAIGDAIALAVKRLDMEKTAQRVVILLTDGFNTAGSLTTDEAANLAAQAGVKIYTVGFGDDPALTLFGFRIPIQMAQPDIDEKALVRMAQVTGGKAYRAHKTEQLAEIYQEIQRLEPITRQAKSIRPVISLYYWPLALGFALLIAALLWHYLTRRRLSA